MTTSCLVPRVALGLLLGCGCSLPRIEPEEPQLREVSMPTPPPETPGGALFQPPQLTHHEVLAQIREAADEDHIKGLYLRLGELGGAWARAAELSTALSAVREADKPVHCHFDATDNLGYALMARSCDRISAAPAGLLNLVGVRAQVLYARELLETLGLTAELMQVGRFKGAADPLTHYDMPQETRDTLGALLDDLQSGLVQALVDGRKLSADEAAAAVDDGPYTPHAAQQRSLVDDVGFDDEAREHAKKAAAVDNVVLAPRRPTQPKVGIFDLLDALAGGAATAPSKEPRVALAFLSGTIVEGNDSSLESAHAVPFVKAMRRFADDDNVKAMVLRIDSGGGSALASDRMWHALRRVAKRKPVIVSIGDMAASGGYWIASGGDEIYAQPESIVGSIGVVGGKIVGADLSKRIGVNVVQLQRGKNSGWADATQPFSESERKSVRALLESTYRRFLRRISTGRDMSESDIGPLAEGRIMSGRRAIQGGLVDKAGGLDDALARARERGDLDPDSRIEVWPPRMELLQRLTHMASGGEASASTSLLGRLARGLGAQHQAPIVQLLLDGNDRVGSVLPFILDIR